MKDYYKILGVEEEASEEEIRARWIELTKRYHPDLVKTKEADEKIREINEAYQVLRNQSTRLEYDLERTYGQKIREGKRESYFKKLSVPASILIVFIIFGIIYFKNFQNKIDQTDQRNLTNQRDQIDQTNLSRLSRSESVQDEMGSLFHWDQINPTNPTNPTIQTDATIPTNITIQTSPTTPTISTNITIQTNPTDAITPMDSKDSTTQRPTDVISPITPSIAQAATMEKVQLPQPPQNPITPLPNDPINNRPTGAINQTNQRNQINPTNPIASKIELPQFKPPSLLATEDEVRKFFGNYIELYNRMDIEGFLSLFSSEAIQNKIYGLRGIRKIYTDFFNQGQGVRYQIQDMKIEIYQNAVEVKARYVIEQVLRTGGGKKVWRGNVCWVLGKENGALKILSLDYRHQ
jgi:hypothetical protein